MRNAMSLRCAVFAMLTSAGAGALAQGYYETIPYYGNDPFIFCTLGVPTDCWAPVNPAIGAFVVTNYYCFNAVSAAIYVRLCPHAFAPTSALRTSTSLASMTPSRSARRLLRDRGVDQG
jgi:hypothetical protein